MSSRGKEFARADEYAQLVLLVWSLIEGTHRPEPEEIAEAIPEDADELKALMETVVEVSRNGDSPAAKKKPRSGRGSASKSG